MKKIALLLFLIFVLSVNYGYAAPEQNKTNTLPVQEVFQPLFLWLTANAIKPAEAQSWLQKTKFESKPLSRMLSHQEVKRDYQQFFTKQIYTKCGKFLEKNKATLQLAQDKTGVPKEIIVAILLIESDLGSYTGNSKTFNMLASQAVLDTKKAKQLLRADWPKAQKDYLDTDACLERFAKRAEWARQELLALIKLSKIWGTSPLSIKGSPAGALGLCQFMPTSIERWGVAVSNPAKGVDVFRFEDAIVSIGNYLLEHGWQKTLAYEEQIQIILTYNKSRPYAEAVLKLASQI